jgi:hypothetical protein
LSAQGDRFDLVVDVFDVGVVLQKLSKVAKKFLECAFSPFVLEIGLERVKHFQDRVQKLLHLVVFPRSQGYFNQLQYLGLWKLKVVVIPHKGDAIEHFVVVDEGKNSFPTS